MQTKNGRIELGSRIADGQKPAVAVDKDGEPVSDPSKSHESPMHKLAASLKGITPKVEE